MLSNVIEYLLEASIAIYSENINKIKAGGLVDWWTWLFGVLDRVNDLVISFQAAK